MTRRLTLVILGTVAAPLLFPGVRTLPLAPPGAREQTPTEPRTQATQIAAAPQNPDDKGQLRVLANLRAALKLEGIAIIRFGPAGRTVDTFPAGVTAEDLDLAKLREGTELSGGSGSLVYAAAPAAVAVPRAQGTGTQ